MRIPANTFEISCVLVAISSAICAAEYLSLPELYSSEGLLAWENLSGHSDGLFASIATCSRAVLPNRLLSIQALFALKLLLSACIVLAIRQPQVEMFLLLVLLMVQLISAYRSVFGGDGSDQMVTIVVAGLLAACLLRHISSAITVGFAFIAAQSAVSYFIAGIAKLRSKEWISGAALYRVLETMTYGKPAFGRWLEKHPLLSRGMCWVVMAFEVSFPLALLAPRSVSLSILAVGIMFHLANAYFMGLNTFFWSFIATYPSVALINTEIRTVLNLH